jgi:tetratricopeptide (TPR) repeat protein
MDSRPPDYSATLEYACLRLLAGDPAGNKQLCRRLAERVGDSADLDVVHELCRVCTLGPGGLDDPAQAVAWSERWTARKPHLPWTLHALGAAYFRAGRFEEAIQRFRESQRLAPSWPGQCMNDAFLALAHAELGQIDLAKRALEKADRWLAGAEGDLAPSAPGVLPKVWPADWLIVQVLRREADRVLASPPARSEAPP